MGNGMNKILPGLYVGDCRDARDVKQLEENKITDILAVFDLARPILADKNYLCIKAEDSATQDLMQHFAESNTFIHKARMEGRGVLVHCMAGMSRSVTLTVAYVMTVTNLGWKEALNAVRGARHSASPNFGFQRQLLTYQEQHVHKERERLRSMYPERNGEEDAEVCRQLIEAHRQWMVSGDDSVTSEDSCLRPSQIGSRRSLHTNHDGTASEGKQSEYKRAVATGLLPASQSNIDAESANATAGGEKTKADELLSIFFNANRQNGESQSSKVEESSGDAAADSKPTTANQENCDARTPVGSLEGRVSVGQSSSQSGNGDILDSLFEKKAV